MAGRVYAAVHAALTDSLMMSNCSLSQFGSCYDLIRNESTVLEPEMVRIAHLSSLTDKAAVTLALCPHRATPAPSFARGPADKCVGWSSPFQIVQILCDVTAGMTFLHAAVPLPLIHSGTSRLFAKSILRFFAPAGIICPLSVHSKLAIRPSDLLTRPVCVSLYAALTSCGTTPIFHRRHQGCEHSG